MKMNGTVLNSCDHYLDIPRKGKILLNCQRLDLDDVHCLSNAVSSCRRINIPNDSF